MLDESLKDEFAGIKERIDVLYESLHQEIQELKKDTKCCSMEVAVEVPTIADIKTAEAEDNCDEIVCEEQLEIIISLMRAVLQKVDKLHLTPEKYLELCKKVREQLEKEID